MIRIDVVRMARTLFDEHGLSDWNLQLDKRAVRRLGRCIHATSTIALSAQLLPKLDEEIVRNTLLHEIAHAKVGPGHGHDRVWQAMALSIGADGKRCVALEEHQAIQKPWVGTCPTEGCETRVERHRLVASMRDACCLKCARANGNARVVYDERFRLVWRKRRTAA